METILKPTGVGEGSQDLHFFMDELFPSLSDYQFPEMELMDDGRLAAEYPGLGSVPVRQRLIYVPKTAEVSVELALVEVENDADAEAVKAVFQKRIDDKAAAGDGEWKTHANIFAGGKYVLLAVHELSEYMVDADFPTALGMG